MARFVTASGSIDCDAGFLCTTYVYTERLFSTACIRIKKSALFLCYVLNIDYFFLYSTGTL